MTIWVKLLAAVGALAAILILAAQLKAAHAELEGQKIALTSYQAALQSSQDALSKSEMIRKLDSDTLASFIANSQVIEKRKDSNQKKQDDLEKRDVPTKSFLDTPTGPELRRLLDEEDGITAPDR